MENNLQKEGHVDTINVDQTSQEINVPSDFGKIR